MSSSKVYRVNTVDVASFTAAAPGAGASWVHVPVIDQPLPKVTQEVDSALESNTRGNATPDVPTITKSAYAFTTRFWTGTKGNDGAGSDADPTSCYLQTLFQSYFGGAPNNAFKGTTVGNTSGPGRTTPMVVASAANLAVGMAIMVNGEVRFITAISGTNITLNCDLSTSPALSDVVYGAWNFSTTLGELTSAYTYMNVERDGHGWLLGPGRINALKLAGFAAGSGLRVDMGFEGNSFAAAVTPSSFVQNAFTGQPIIAKGGQVAMDTVLTSIADASVDFGAQHERILDSTGSNGIKGYEIVSQATPKATVKEFYAAARFTSMQTRTPFPFSMGWTVGSTNAAKGRGFVGIFMPNAQVIPVEDNIQNQVGMGTTIEGRDPTSAQVTAGLTRPVYFAIGGGI